MEDELISTFRVLTIQAVQVSILEEIYQELLKCLEEDLSSKKIMEILKVKIAMLFAAKYLNSERDEYLQSAILKVLSLALYNPASFRVFTLGMKQGAIDGLKEVLLKIADTDDINCQTITQMFNSSNMDIFHFAISFYDNVIKYSITEEDGVVITEINNDLILSSIKNKEDSEFREK